MMEQKIFIVGCPRSGTTLLQSRLLKINGSYSMPETNFFLKVADNYYVSKRSLPPFEKIHYPEKVDLQAVERVIESLNKNNRIDIRDSVEKVLKEKAVQGVLSVEECFSAIAGCYRPSGKTVMIEKTPGHVFHIPYIKKIFPESIIIAIIRDPRDVYISYIKMLEKQGKPGRSIREFSYIWAQSSKEILRTKIPFVKYEDFIEDDLSVLDKLLSPYNFTLNNTVDVDYESIVRKEESWKKNVNKPVNRNNKGKFKKILTKNQIAHINHCCSEQMLIFGYNCSEHLRGNVAYSFFDSLTWVLHKQRINRKILDRKNSL